MVFGDSHGGFACLGSTLKSIECSHRKVSFFGTCNATSIFEQNIITIYSKKKNWISSEAVRQSVSLPASSQSVSQSVSQSISH